VLHRQLARAGGLGPDSAGSVAGSMTALVSRQHITAKRPQRGSQGTGLGVDDLAARAV
jgi:hypothetical protein